MPDILDSAQKQIDEATNALPAPSLTSSSTPPTAPAQKPAASPAPNSPPPSAPPEPASSLPKEPTPPAPKGVLTVEPPAAGPATVVESLLTASVVPAKQPPSRPPHPKSPFPAKKSRKGLLLTILLILFITVPLGAYYVSQQQQLAEIRSRAQQGPYPDGYPCFRHSDCTSGYCDGPRGVCWPARGGTATPTRAAGSPTPTPTGGVCAGLGGEGQVCRVPQNCNNLPNCDGNLICLNGTCQKPQTGGCGSTNRCRVHICDRCSNYGGGLDECRSPGQEVPCDQAAVPAGQCGQVDILDAQGNYCGVKQQACTGACSGGPPPTQPPGGTPQPTPPPGGYTPTPTSPPSGGQCTAIAVYDADGNNITQGITSGSRKLSPGETVILGTPKGTSSKARFRIQGITEFQEHDSAATTGTEFRLRIQIPTNITQAQGSFEAEVFINGQWR